MDHPVDYQQWSGLVILNGRVEQRLAEALQHGHSLGLSEYRALCYLSGAADGQLRMQQLADSTGLNQSSVSRLVQRLEKQGLVERSHCADDRRGVRTSITTSGRHRQHEAYPTYVDALTSALDDAAEDSQLAPLVSRLRDA